MNARVILLIALLILCLYAGLSSIRAIEKTLPGLPGSRVAPSSAYWHTVALDDGRVRVICDNNGDATVEPGASFSSIIVSCGTRN